MGVISGLLGGLGELGGGLLSDLFNGGDRDAIEQLLKESMDEYGNVSEDKLRRLIATKQGGTEYDKMQSDPRLQAAQMKALDSLGREGDQSGMTAEDRATYEAFQGDAARKEKSQRDAVLARTQPNSGARIAMMGLNQQASADRGAQAALGMAGDARTRALQAMSQGGQLAGNIRGQNFQEGAARAGAQDAINRFNAGQQTDMDKYKYGQEQELADKREKLRQQKLGRHQDNIDRTRKVGRDLGGAAGSAIGMIPGIP